MKFTDYTQRRQADPRWRDRKHLSVGERFLYSVMALTSNQECWFGFSVAKMAEATGTSERAVQRWLKTLRAKEYISRDESSRGGYYIINPVLTEHGSEAGPQSTGLRGQAPEYGNVPTEHGSEARSQSTERTQRPDDGVLRGPQRRTQSTGENVLTGHPQSYSTEEVQKEVLTEGSAHARKNSDELLFGDAPADIPDDDPYGLFATDSLDALAREGTVVQ